jgi:hypothetical protein
MKIPAKIWAVFTALFMFYEWLMPYRYKKGVWGGRWKRNPREG